MGYIENPPVALNQLLEVVPDGIAFVDEYGVICHANKRLEGLTGYARDEFARDPIPRVPVMARHLDYRLLRRDGSELMVDVARAQFVLDGKPWAVVAVCDDSGQRTAGHVRTKAELRAIATELAAAEALASSEQRFRLAFENNVAGMILVDLEDKVLAVNDSFCQMVGRNRE
jgi:PAS domain-containing protein